MSVLTKEILNNAITQMTEKRTNYDTLITTKEQHEFFENQLRQTGLNITYNAFLHENEMILIDSSLFMPKMEIAPIDLKISAKSIFLKNSKCPRCKSKVIYMVHILKAKSKNIFDNSIYIFYVAKCKSCGKKTKLNDRSDFETLNKKISDNNHGHIFDRYAENCFRKNMIVKCLELNYDTQTNIYRD